MLALFGGQTASLTDPKTFLRNFIRNNLDKGIVPMEEEIFSFLPHTEEADLVDLKFWYRNLKDGLFLKPFFSESLQEIFCHGVNLIELQATNGEKRVERISLDLDDWNLFLDMLAMREKQNWNLSTPFASFYLKLSHHSFRATLLHASVSPENTPKLFLRRLNSVTRSPLDYGEAGSMILDLFKSHENILIAGSTGSGKTSFLSALLHHQKENEHLIVLEDTFEIILKHASTTRLLADEKMPAKNLKSYMSYSMRMSPDRLVIGELRGGEVVPFMLAMNTGHKGLMSTVHASSAYDALSRLGMLFGLYSDGQQISYAQVLQLICRNIGYVVFMENKKVKEVIKVLGSENGQAFYETVYSSIPL